MTTVYGELIKREKAGSPIRLGIIGTGQMGFGLVSALSTVPGMVPHILCNRHAAKAEKAAAAYLAGGEGKDRPLITTDFQQAVEEDKVDLVVEATGVPETGAAVALACLKAGKPLVTLNVEMDAAVGPLLKKKFDEQDLVYSGISGDEPGAIYELYQLARVMGAEVLAAGKGKNNKVVLDANPDRVEKEARERGLNPVELTSFQDGTNTMLEMTSLSNATGLVADVPGMHGIRGGLEETLQQLDLEERGGILKRLGILDYVIGLAPGVFLILQGQNQGVGEVLDYIMIKKNDHHILYRPFHLGSLEVPMNAAQAFLYHQAAIAPVGSPISETVAVAKKDLEKGEPLDGIGGYCLRGVMENHASQQEEGHIPISLFSEEGNSRARRPIRKGEYLHWEDVEMDEASCLYQLRKEQDQFFG